MLFILKVSEEYLGNDILWYHNHPSYEAHALPKKSRRSSPFIM